MRPRSSPRVGVVVSRRQCLVCSCMRFRTSWEKGRVEASSLRSCFSWIMMASLGCFCRKVYIEARRSESLRPKTALPCTIWTSSLMMPHRRSKYRIPASSCCAVHYHGFLELRGPRLAYRLEGSTSSRPDVEEPLLFELKFVELSIVKSATVQMLSDQSTLGCQPQSTTNNSNPVNCIYEGSDVLFSVYLGAIVVISSMVQSHIANVDWEPVLVTMSRLVSSLLRLQGTWPEVVVALGEVIMTCWHTADISDI
ncbi:hypothetical protein KCV06_g489, partial [Aureobasidium melanogenum]